MHRLTAEDYADRHKGARLYNDRKLVAEYARDHLATVTGIEASAALQPKYEIQLVAAYPQIYAAIATIWPELAKACPILSWN